MVTPLRISVVFASFAVAFVAIVGSPGTAYSQPASAQVPTFRLDPSWPVIPNEWLLGEVSSVAVDAQDHVWLLHRPNRVPAAQRSQAAPAVLEFDANGKFVQAWGGKGPGYEWPDTEHGVFVDHNGFVWIGGNGGPDDQLLKFTRTGTFVMQIGRSAQSRGNADTANLYRPADVFVEPRSNEVFVADGYGNRRIAVFDAATGAFKRMWGAFGNAPDGPLPPSSRAEAALTDPVTTREEGKGSEQFNLVHSVRISKDGLVYVADRANRRLQVFTTAGRFVAQTFISRDCVAPECGNGQTTASVAFSHDPGQRFLYVADRSRGRIRILERSTLRELAAFGGGMGTGPGQFNVIHHIATDSQGNLYATEVNPGARAQKFDFVGFQNP